MAQYFNIVTDDSVPITVDDVQQICSPDGRSFRLVLQDVNNGVNGPPSLITYAASSDTSSPSFLHQTLVGSSQHTTVSSEQNVYVINTEPINSNIDKRQAPTLISTKDHTPRIVRANTKVPLSTSGERQDIQWIQTTDFNKSQAQVIKNQTQKTALAIAHLEQGTSNKLVDNKIIKNRNKYLTPGTESPCIETISETVNPNVTKNVMLNRTTTPTFRLKSILSPNAPPKPSPRSPIRPENQQQMRPVNAPVSSVGSIRTPLANQHLESLSERIKHARTQNRRNTPGPVHQPSMQISTSTPAQKTTPRPSYSPGRPRLPQNLPSRQANTPMNIQHQRPMPPCPNNTDLNPESMEVSYPKYSPIKSNQMDQSQADGESNSESFAYLQKTIDNPATAIVQQQINGNVVKMLVALPSGEQRLITFDIPSEECTVQDLLEQANIPSNGRTVVSLVTDTMLNINYIVESEEGVIATVRDTSDTSDPPELLATPTEESNNSALTQHEEPRFIEGRLAVCPNCGISSMDFNRCSRCRKKLPSDVKQVQMTTTAQQKKEAMININNYYKKKCEQQKFNVDRDCAAKRPRGRPRGVPLKVKPKEPECLTLSSDDEDGDGNKKKMELQNNAPAETHMNVMCDMPEMISDKEPIITNSVLMNVDGSIHATDMPLRSDSNNGEGYHPPIDDGVRIQTSLVCRTVRIGSYKYVPRDKIILNQHGLLLAVPLLEDNNRLMPIQIKFPDIVKLLIHFGKQMPVLFFYTTPSCGAMIREVLGMQDSKGPYFDPAGKDHTHKRITLLPEKISEESKNIYKTLFVPGMNLEELNAKEANDILVRASPKSPSQPQSMIKKPNLSIPVNSNTTNGRQQIDRLVQKMTVYPAPPAKSGIAINTEDYACLGEDQFLNDVIIDFYLKYLTLEVLSEVDHQRTHVFSSYFYKRLTSRHAQAPDNNVAQSPAAKRHARVQKWTKNVNIFEKDFIIIPINEHAHWFLAIICFPGLVGTVIPTSPPTKDPDNKKRKKKEVKLQTLTIGSTTITPVATTITLDPADDDSERDEAEGDDDEMDMDNDSEDEEDELHDTEENTVFANSQPSNSVHQQNPEVSVRNDADDDVIKSPCILIFDSLAGASRSRVVATLRDYLSCEHVAKVGTEKIFSKDTIKGSCPKVPQQSNFTDCGLYVLQYVESFFQNPIKNYTLPIKVLKNWFEEIIVTRKREELSNLLIKLMNETKGDKTINIPTVQFPTQDGKLKPKSENSEKSELKVLKADGENKKKPTTTDEETSGTNAHQQQCDDREPGELNPTRFKTTLYPLGPSSSSLTASTDTNCLEMVDMKNKVPVAGNSMTYLRNKRIPRLASKEEAQESQMVAKKHKGDAMDCK